MQLPPPPRKVRGHVGWGVWFLRIFVLPHTCLGIMIVGIVLLRVLTALFGTDRDAVVTKADRRTSKGETFHVVDYAYRVNGHDYSSSESVSPSVYALNGTSDGKATVRVRYFGIDGAHYSLIVQGISWWKSIGGMLLMALFWNGILSIFLYIAWIDPIRHRQLMRDGSVTTGTIVGRNISRGKTVRYYAVVRFGEDIERHVSISEQDYEVATEGRPVTVIYDPRKPKRATVYEFSGYTVDGAVSTPSNKWNA